jgi:curved DNA-binding protein CbpA
VSLSFFARIDSKKERAKMEEADDPYKILGVPRDADVREIKLAYRKKALQHHPDKQKTDEERAQATVLFSKISNAYELLSDEQQRNAYDSNQQQQRENVHFNHDDLFGQRFGHSGFHDHFHHSFHDPFQVFREVFREEFGGPSANFHHSRAGAFPDGGLDYPTQGRGNRMDPFGSFFGGGSLFGGSMFGGGGGRDPFDDMFSSMQRLQSRGHQFQQRSNGAGNDGSVFYSSSSTTSSFGGANATNRGESVTTQTTTRIINGQQQTVTERIVRKADGTVERHVEQSGPDGYSTLEPDPQRGHARRLLSGKGDTGDRESPSSIAAPAAGQVRRRNSQTHAPARHKKRRNPPAPANEYE